MTLSIKDLHKVRASLPPRVLIYGPPGIGKTQLASEWPDPVFIQVEDGTPSDLELISFGRIVSYNDVMEGLAALYSEEHDYRTVVIDSLDKLEPMVWAKVCEDNGWANMESAGYGKAYLSADMLWREMLEGANALRRDKNMNIVYIAHSTIDTVNDPTTTSYSQYNIRLHRRAVGIFQDEVDCILFITQDISILQNDPKARGGPGARVRAAGGGNRFIHATPRPAYIAKNRYNLPDKMQYEKNHGWEKIAPYFPGNEEQVVVSKRNGKAPAAKQKTKQQPETAEA